MADDRETRLDRACVEYLWAFDAGYPPEREAWLATHADIADELRDFIDGLSSVEGLLAPLRDDRDATVDRQATVADSNTPTMPDGYELIRPIAAGGMGVVYRARQVAVNRDVALKMIRAGALAGESAVQRFRMEAEAAAGFDHPHIVPVYEVGVTTGGQPFFSMKLIDGRTLTDWLGEGHVSGRLNTQAGLRDAIRLFTAVCRAVHYAHQRGFLHRDLKPANVLVDAAGVPHVTDFGLAKRISERPTDVELTEAGGLVGTLAYMAPEQAHKGERLTTATDVYSLGAILFLMLTGRPLRSNPVAELMAGTLGRTLPSLHSIAPTVDRDLEAICLKCLTEDPAGRFGSAEALADELDRWADGRPIHTRPPHLIKRLWLLIRRRPRSAALVVVAAALLALGVGMVTWKWQEAQEKGSQSAAAVARSLMEPEADGDSRELGTAALWWVRSFEQAPITDTRLRQTARANLAALAGRLHTLRIVRQGVPPTAPSGSIEAVSTEGWRAVSEGNKVLVFKGKIQLGEEIVHDDLVRAVAFSPRGNKLITGGDEHDARVWQYTQKNEWQEVARLEHQEYVRAIAFSPDGRLVATGGADGVAQVWDAVTFRRVGQLLPHDGWVERVVFSADGQELTTATADGTERVWELSAAAREDRCWALGAAVYAVAPTPDGRVVYAGTEAGLYHLSIADPTQPEKPLRSGITWAVTVHPQSEWVAAGGPKGQEGWFAVLRTDGREFGPFELPQPVRTVAVTPDGSRVFITTATTQDGGLWEWGEATPNVAPRQLGQHQPTWAVAVIPDDGRYVTSTGDGLIRIQPTGETITHPPRKVALAVLPGGQRVAAASTDGSVRVWKIGNNNPVWEERHHGAVWAVNVSPDGKLIASGGRDRCVRVWDANTGTAVGPPLDHGRVVWAVTFSPDGKWIWSGSEDGTVRRRLAPNTTLDVPDGRLHQWAKKATSLQFDPIHTDRTRTLSADEWHKP